MKGPYNLSLSIIFFSILSNLLLLPYPPRCLSCGLGALHRSFPSAAALPPMQPSLAVGAPLPWHRMLSLSLGPATPWPCRTRITASPCPPLPYGRTHSCHELCRPRAPVDARAYAASPDDRAPVASCACVMNLATMRARAWGAKQVSLLLGSTWARWRRMNPLFFAPSHLKALWEHIFRSFTKEVILFYPVSLKTAPEAVERPCQMRA